MSSTNSIPDSSTEDKYMSKARATEASSSEDTTFFQAKRSREIQDETIPAKAPKRRVTGTPNNTAMKGSREHLNSLPSRPLSAYNIFFRDERQKILAEWEEASKYRAASTRSIGSEPHSSDGSKPSSNLFQSMAKRIGKAWRELASQKRDEYKRLAEADKERYRRESDEYRESIIRSSREAARSIVQSQTQTGGNLPESVPHSEQTTRDSSAAMWQENSRAFSGNIQAKEEYVTPSSTEQYPAPHPNPDAVRQELVHQSTETGSIRHGDKYRLHHEHQFPPLPLSDRSMGLENTARAIHLGTAAPSLLDHPLLRSADTPSQVSQLPSFFDTNLYRETAAHNMATVPWIFPGGQPFPFARSNGAARQDELLHEALLRERLFQRVNEDAQLRQMAVPQYAEPQLEGIAPSTTQLPGFTQQLRQQQQGRQQQLGHHLLLLQLQQQQLRSASPVLDNSIRFPYRFGPGENDEVKRNS